MGAFRNCTTLKTIYIPSSVEGIGMGCFSGCTNLKTAIFEDVTYWVVSKPQVIVGGEIVSEERSVEK